MAEIRLPFSIIYETEGTTPIADVVIALQATDALMRDAVSLLPSLVDGLVVDDYSLNVRSLTQESPLRELFLVSLIIAFQNDLQSEVPPVIEDILNIAVSDRYDTLITVAFMAIAFYGAGISIDAAKKTFADSLPRAKFEELVQVLASETGKPAGDIRSIVEAKFGKPAHAKRLAGYAKRLFWPSQKDQNAPVFFDRDRISTELIREIPFPTKADQKTNFNRYTPYSGVSLELHAQDRDRAATGWAAVARNVSDRRLIVRVMDPVLPSDLWGKDEVQADIVVVSKLTSNGYDPVEIQIVAVGSSG